MIGTPITGNFVNEAVIPGRCADPPAPAIITLIPRDEADFAINGSKNAALLALRILAVSDSVLSDKLQAFMDRQTKAVMDDSL